MRGREKDTQPGLGTPERPADQRDAPASTRQPTARGLGTPASPSVRERSEGDTLPSPIVVPGSTFPRGENDSLDDILGELTKKRIPVPASFESGRAEAHAPQAPPSRASAPQELPVVVDETTEPPSSRAPVRVELTPIPLPRSRGALWLLVAFAGLAVVAVVAWVATRDSAPSPSVTRDSPPSATVNASTNPSPASAIAATTSATVASPSAPASLASSAMTATAGAFGNACQGGRGGSGGNGGSGGGGGLSAGVVWFGTAPTVNGTSTPTAATLTGVTLGAAGAGGTGANAGKAGTAGAVVQFQ